MIDKNVLSVDDKVKRFDEAYDLLKAFFNEPEEEEDWHGLGEECLDVIIEPNQADWKQRNEGEVI